MNRDVTLRLLGHVMDWDQDEAHREYAWLELIASIKYDTYRDFEAGMRFMESLARWIQQFEKAERQAAYEFVRHRLLFIGPREMHRLIDQFYPKFAHPTIVNEIAARNDIPAWQTMTTPQFRDDVASLRRKTLFLGLSDGARIDVFRHHNVGRITNEQVAPTTQLDEHKWQDVLDDLRKVEGPDARFEIVYLIDDFVGTGTTFLRPKEDSDEWTGKLSKFFKSIGSRHVDLFSDDAKLVIHHYIASHDATCRLEESLTEADGWIQGKGWSKPRSTYGMRLPAKTKLSVESPSDEPFIRLAEKYYDRDLEDEHTIKGGTEKVDLGYGGCALPIVLEHNTPNNSVALLWAETDGQNGGAAMRALFRRRQRHVKGQI
ncbi:phosphoribosyltransferase-like protein [Cellulomonas sp. URHB0016]